MKHSTRVLILMVQAGLLALMIAGYTQGQTVTYHLHKDASGTTGLNQLKTAGPDAATVAVTSSNLKNLATGEYIIKGFDTQSGVPNASGVIPAGSTVTFTLWLKKTANVGTMFPRAKLNLNSAGGASLCSTTGGTALTTTLTSYTLNCTTASNITMTATDRFYLWVGVNLTATGGSNFMGSLNVEGTLNGNYNSRIVVPLPITPPSISSLSATSGPVGTSITVNGANFGSTQGSSTLKFNDVTATPTSWNASSIVAPVPSDATTGPVVVTVQGAPSNSVTFTVTPKVNSLSSNSGAVGTSVTISGTTFGATQGSSTVTFNGTAATPTTWSATSIAVPVPAGATTGPVVVTVSGQASNGVTFTVTPKIDSLSSTSGPVGTAVTISGATFGATQGSSTVTFNGTAATPTSWSATSIAVPVPAGATTGPVVVTVSGQASNGVSFTVTPKIDNLSPSSGAAGSAITISGTTFGATQGTSTITFNGTAATPTSWGDSSIAAPVPAGATSGPVVVTVNSQASNAVTFTVPARIDNLSPTSGEIGAPITISGSAFGPSQGSSTVTFNGITATPTSWSANSIEAPVPAGATTGPVVVTVDGASSNGVTFTVPTTGTISGRITAGDGTTPIPGATVKALQGSTTIATTSTNGTGDYSLTPLDAGTYTITASATGYGNKSRSAVSVTGGATTTVNLSLDAIVSGPVSYIYDPLGRLKATVGPVDTVVYDYDAVGNLLSIARQSSGQVSIIQFTPGSGPVGTTVTISGTGFSATPSQNTVTFNGVSATVTQATATQLVVTVPAGATTGPIAVTSPSGSATSSTSFTVGANGSGAPAITGFTPAIGPAGTAVTIDGSNFETVKTNNKVKFNLTRAGVTSASATSMVSNAPNGTSGRISVTTPYGSATSAADFYLTPSPYVAADVVVTERMNFGESRTASIPTANKVGMIIFDGTAGQRVSLKMSSVTFSNSIVTIYKPDGTTLASVPVTTAGGFIEPLTLPLSGTYTILVDPAGSATGSMLINLYNVPADVTGTIVAGGSPVPLSLGTPGQNANITFTGSVGQKVSLSLTSLSITGLRVYVYHPDGSQLAFLQMAGVYGDDMIDTLVLPTNGTYSILVNPTTSYTGGISLTLNDTTDINGTIVAGTPVVQSINTPGKNAYFSFTGNAGQRFSLKITGASYTSSYSQGMFYEGAHASILNPDGSTLATVTFTAATAFIDTVTLPAAGTYKVLLDPRHANTGSATLTLYEVSDITGSIVIGGSSVPVSLGTPGQSGTITFDGTAEQKVSLSLTSLSITQLWVYVKNPDGSTLASRQMAGVYGDDMIGTLVLPTSGTYSILLNPTSSYTGNITLTLNDASDINGTITADGTQTVQSITTPGKNAYLSFTGTAGQRVALHITGISYNNTYSQGLYYQGGALSIINPDLSTLTSTSFIFNNVYINATTLPASGTYKILVDPHHANTGNVTLALHDVPPDFTATVQINDPPINVPLNAVGQHAQISFDGTSGQQTTIRITNNTIIGVRVKLLAPDGSQIYMTNFGADYNINLPMPSLPATGTYTVIIDPYIGRTGSLDLRVTIP